MMHFYRRSVERLGRSLRLTYDERGKTEITPSDFWAVGVMSEVRRIGSLNVEIDFWTVFERMLWKFIPAAVALVLIMGVAFTRIDPVPNNIVADIYSGENVDSGLYAFYDR